MTVIKTGSTSIKEVKLLDGQRFENEFLYSDYFKSLDEKYAAFEYIPIVSRDNSSSTKKGYVTDLLKDIDVANYKVYMCGSKNMIQDSYNILLDKGVKKEDIFYESEDKVFIN